MKSYIYKITSPSGAVYIGQTISIKRRHKEYLKASSESLKKQRKLYFSLCKYGFLMHAFDILEKCDKSKASEREIYYIEKFNSFKNGMNLTKGGEGGMGVHTPKTEKEKEDISFRNTKYRNIYCYDNKGLFKGCFDTAKIASKVLKISYGNIIANLKDKNDHVGGFRFYTTEQNYLDEIKITIEREVVQLSRDGVFIEKFKSATDAGKKNNFIGTSISRCCKEKTILAHGYAWKFVEDFESGAQVRKTKRNCSHLSKIIEKVDNKGVVVEVFNSATDLHKKDGFDHKTITKYLNKTRVPPNGFTYNRILK